MHPFSPKALRFIKRHPSADRTISILQGATRGGKTFACIPKILALCRYKVDGHRVICGVTKQTVYKNFLAPLFDIVGPKTYSYNKNSGELTLFGVKWLVEGAADEGAVKGICGRADSAGAATPGIGSTADTSAAGVNGSGNETAGSARPAAIRVAARGRSLSIIGGREFPRTATLLLSAGGVMRGSIAPGCC